MTQTEREAVQFLKDLLSHKVDGVFFIAETSALSRDSVRVKSMIRANGVTPAALVAVERCFKKKVKQVILEAFLDA